MFPLRLTAQNLGGARKGVRDGGNRTHRTLAASPTGGAEDAPPIRHSPLMPAALMIGPHFS